MVAQNGSPPLQRISLTLLRIPHLFLAMTLRLSQLTGDAVVLSTANATAMADGLLRMAHCLIVELPEPQLQDLRYTLDLLLMRVDQILDAEDLCLNFDGLTTNPGEFSRLRLDVFSPVLSLRPSASPAGRRFWRDSCFNHRQHY